MAGPHISYIPEGPSERIDYLGMMMLSSPTFKDKTGYFYDRNTDTVFRVLNESLQLIRRQIGDLYFSLKEMSGQMRAHFEADPEDKTDECTKGRALIVKMTEVLIQSIREARQASPR